MIRAVNTGTIVALLAAPLFKIRTNIEDMR